MERLVVRRYIQNLSIKETMMSKNMNSKRLNPQKEKRNHRRLHSLN